MPTQDDHLPDDLDRLEAILAHKDAELRLLHSELDLRQLYVTELHQRLEGQARQLLTLEERLTQLEAGAAARDGAAFLSTSAGSRR